MSELSNAELREALVAAGAAPGPVNDATRKVWLKKLATLGGPKAQEPKAAPEPPKPTPTPAKRGRGRPPATAKAAAKAAAPPPSPEVVVIGDSDEETLPEIKPKGRGKASKSPARAANKVIPGKAYMKGGGDGPAEAPKAKQPSPTKARGPSRSSARSAAAANSSGSAASVGYSDTDESPSPIRVDRSLNTSFLPPKGRRSIASSGASPVGLRSSPFLSRSAAEVDYGFGRSGPPRTLDDPDEDEDGTTRRRKVVTSPLDNVKERLASFRRTVFGPGGDGSVALAKRTRGSLPAFGGPRPVPKTLRGQAGSTLGNGWGESWPMLMVVGLVCFLGVVGLGYAATAYQREVRAGLGLVRAAGADTAAHLYQYLVLPVLGLCLLAAALASLYWLRKHRLARAEADRAALFKLVEDICGILEHQAEQVALGMATDAGCPIPYVRDQLIAPKERAQKAELWNRAVAYVNDSEGRVRTEAVFRDGVESSMWVWLPPAAPKKGWQGRAFGNGPLETADTQSAREAFSECLKIRGLLADDKDAEGRWVVEVTDALLEKLHGLARVVHVAVDRKSPEGLVYAKLANKVEAGAAFKALHGSWYSGHMVSVKYMRAERYEERFPDTARAAVPLQPSRPHHKPSAKHVSRWA